MAIKPMYVHDCDDCIFLAHEEGSDVYACKNTHEKEGWCMIARYSSDPPNNSWLWPSAAEREYPHLVERAKEVILGRQ